MKKQDEQLNTQVLKVRIDEFISCDTFLAWRLRSNPQIFEWSNLKIAM
jgi:hypothetical protein